MCGRFTISVVIGLYDRFKARPPPFEIQPRYNIAPSQEIPTIRVSSENPAEREVVMMRWGLVPSWATDTKIGFRTINARAESLITTPAFRYNVQHHRCLIPATGFFEWKHEGTKKVPYFIHRKDGALFAFAGIYDTWRGPDSSILSTFTIVTTEPNKLVAPLHNRMPAMLTRENENVWMARGQMTANDLADIIAPYPLDELEAYRVSSVVNDPDNESREVIRKIGEEFS